MFASGPVYRPALLAFRAGVGRLPKPSSRELLTSGVLLGTVISPWLAIGVGAESASFLPTTVAITATIGAAFRTASGHTLSRFLQPAAVSILARACAAETGRAAHQIMDRAAAAADGLYRRLAASYDRAAEPVRAAGAFTLGLMVGMVAILAVGLGPRLQAPATAATPVLAQIDPTAMTWRASVLPEISANGI